MEEGAPREDDKQMCIIPRTREHSPGVNRFTDGRSVSLTLWPEFGGSEVTVVENSNSFILKNQ